MADKQIKVILTMDGKQYAVEIDKATGKTKKLSNEAGRATSMIHPMTRAMSGSVVAANKMAKGMAAAGRQQMELGKQTQNTRLQMDFLKKDILTLKNSLAVLGVGLVTREFIRAGIEMERMNNQMLAATGNSVLAANEMTFVRGEAERLGLQLASSSEQFAKLTAASKGTELQGKATRDIFTAVSEASRVLELSAQDTEGALRAIEQMISKGNVQAEELRGQLGERIPGAFQIAARAMKVTTEELNDMLDGGEVLAADLLPAMARELQNTFGDNLDVAVNSATANINRFENQLFDLKVTMSQDLLPVFTQGIQLLSDFAGGFVLLGERAGFWERSINNLSLGQLTVEIEELDEQIRDHADALKTEDFIGIDPIVEKRMEAMNELIQRRADIIKRIIELQQRQKDLENGGSDETGGALISAPDDPKSEERFNKLEDSLRRQLGLIGTTTQAEKLRYEFSEGALKDLNSHQKTALAHLADEIDKQNALLELSKQRKKQQKEDVDELAHITTVYHQQHEQGLDTNIEQWRQLDQELTVYENNIEEITESTRNLDGVGRELGFTFSSAFEDAIIEGKGFRDVLSGIGQDIARIALRKSITEPLGGFVSQVFSEEGFGISNLFASAAAFHAGGVAGSGEGQRRSASPAVFTNAPRYHSGGILPGEVPAILKQGEGVFTPEQMKALGNSIQNNSNNAAASEPIVINYSPVIQAVDTRSGIEFLAEHKDVVVGLVDQAVRKRGKRLFA